jgi:hypothetical protein
MERSTISLISFILHYFDMTKLMKKLEYAK